MIWVGDWEGWRVADRSRTPGVKSREPVKQLPLYPGRVPQSDIEMLEKAGFRVGKLKKRR